MFDELRELNNKITDIKKKQWFLHSHVRRVIITLMNLKFY